MTGNNDNETFLKDMSNKFIKHFGNFESVKTASTPDFASVGIQDHNVEATEVLVHVFMYGYREIVDHDFSFSTGVETSRSHVYYVYVTVVSNIYFSGMVYIIRLCNPTLEDEPVLWCKFTECIKR